MWIGFPSHPDVWFDDFAAAQVEVAALARALAGPGAERVRLLVDGDDAQAAAQALLGDTSVEIVRGTFGDIWLRDTGPIFIDDHGQPAAAGFRFNGWGGKYEMEGDEEVAGQLAAAAGVPLLANDFILEGGSLDHDGLGTALTTRQCVLNPNRNAGWTEASAAEAFAKAMGVRKVLWLDDGLLHDHTDGHIDNLARFVAPGVVACPMAFGVDDPNAAVYARVAQALAGMTDARGSGLQVARIPSPGRVLDENGDVVPASHMNFLIANEAVIVPTYGTPSEGFAVEALASLFPERQVIGLPSRAILTGGGSFHCISQQEPT
jgi:agmatine deiminase